ncbi:hypothetical protein KQI52_09110 [bacterium]|nr:hypothetical protein [bacterium]
MKRFQPLPRVSAAHALIAAIMLLVALPPALAQFGDVDRSGYVRSYIGALTQQDGDYAIVQNALDLRFDKTGPQIGFHVNPYIYQYPDPALSPRTDEFEIDLRQAYVDLYFDTFDVRMGKQQIVWGKADGVFITDIVSPKDLSEFLLRDFSEIRIGVTAAKLDYYTGNNTFELVWLPVFTPTIAPEEGSLWRPAFELSVAMPTRFDRSEEEVGASLDNSELFARWSMISSAYDFELIAGWMWEDEPILQTAIKPSSLPGAPDSLVVLPEHHRLLTVGGSASTTVGPWVFTGEAAFVKGAWFETKTKTIPVGAIENDYIHWMGGLSRDIAGTTISSQFIQTAVLDHQDAVLADEFDNMMTLSLRDTFMRETLGLELFSYIGFNESDALVRPSVDYSFADAVNLTLGANLFFGGRGTFGQYSDNDMVYLKVRFDF